MAVPELSDAEESGNDEDVESSDDGNGSSDDDNGDEGGDAPGDNMEIDDDAPAQGEQGEKLNENVQNTPTPPYSPPP